MNKIQNKIARKTLKLMLDDLTKINKENINIVIEHIPFGEYTLLFSKSIIDEGSSFDDRKRSLFLLEHECLDHGVPTKDCYGYEFIKTLYYQLIYKGF